MDGESGLTLCKNTGNLEAFHKDWELIIVLNSLGNVKGGEGLPDRESVSTLLSNGMKEVRTRLSTLDIPFKVPETEPYAVLWPGTKQI